MKWSEVILWFTAGLLLGLTAMWVAYLVGIPPIVSPIAIIPVIYLVSQKVKR